MKRPEFPSAGAALRAFFGDLLPHASTEMIQSLRHTGRYWPSVDRALDREEMA